ncbi:ATP-binding protein [Actinomadura rupiterrae]|uniref:ATP-binding protein n=1 Tax=Actinomadura rupiterrae TaxID=559627 RepID=UPI0020A35C41|nr:LuxR C-terminal-related transcriptional regulator [Actinomadura rupiterrae]MCP2342074.1 putative ATPase/DNA-binding CsgD family transcriptional regulator [Actinomadura rupiterrae]
MGERISEREAEVLAALGARLTNAQIAGRLHISVRTVESHVSALLRKYGMADRWALAELARAGDREPGRLAGLPVSGTTFVGREADRAAVLAALGEARLVTLLGPGGVGKTRLAALTAENAVAMFPSGGAFVDLVPVRDGFVARAVATALGVTEGSHQALDEAVAARLGTGRSLLVLDNCEHVIDEAAAFAERILAACPDVRVLVTSRERLGVPRERSVPLAPLPLGSDAERLFLDRARAADPQFVADPAVVADLCARLDGMPLAIELAAARAASLGATGLLAALDDALRLLSGGRGGHERHRSLNAVLSWSHDLLDEDEQELFRRLGVFVGSFDLHAASTVAGAGAGAGGQDAGVADLLGRLVDKSLVVHVRGRVSRWRLLETVRAFALAKMAAAGEEDKTRQQHLRWAAGAASATEDRLGDPAWREDFDAMAADLRAALAACGGPGERPHRLASALAHLTFARRHLLESFAHHRTAAALAPDAASAARDLRAGAGCAHVGTTSNQHVYELLLEAAAEAHQAGDDRGRAVDLARAVETACRFPEAFETPVPAEHLRGLLDEAGAADPRDDPRVTACLALARAWLAGPVKGAPDADLAASALATARTTEDPVLVSAGLCAVGTAALRAGRLREANRITAERLRLLPSMDRDDPYCAPEICNTYGRACIYAIMAGDLPGAMAAARAGIEDDLLSDTHITASRLVQPLALTGRFAEAIEHAERMWDQWERAGRPAPLWMLPAVSTTVLASAMLGEPVAPWRARAAEVAGDTLGTQSVAAFVDARLALHDGRHDDADTLVRRAFAVEGPLDPYLAYARAAGAELAVAAGLPDAEDRLATAAAFAEENAWAAACLARTRARLNHDPTHLDHSIQAWEHLDAQAERAHTLTLRTDL